MTSPYTAKQYKFQWQPKVPKALLDGNLFDRWDEDLNVEYNCHVVVDEYGFYIRWRSDGGDGQVLECSQVNDIKQGVTPRDPKLLESLDRKGNGPAEDRTITICSGADFVNISFQHFVAQDSETAKVWLNALRQVAFNHKANNVCPMTQLKKHWMKLVFTKNASGRIPIKNIIKTFASRKTAKKIAETLQEIGLPGDEDTEESLFTFDKFYELYHKICPRSDLEELFSNRTNSHKFMTVDQFVDFLNERQRDPRLNEILSPFYTRDTAAPLIRKYEPDKQLRDKRCLSMDGFCRYLMSDDNAPVFLDRLEIYQDMDKPLCHYFINSSHNTYLVGRQFGGRSSVDMYRMVLLAGCRCIELDCWDGKNEDQEPIITHGNAMCTNILFKDVINAIADTAFVTSDFPVILSFENHCSKTQQYKLAKYCEEVFGDCLLKSPLDGVPLEKGKPLPSPNQLKRKILIKNKRLKPEEEKRQLEIFLRGGQDQEEQAAVEQEEEEEPMTEEEYKRHREQEGQEPIKEDEAQVELNLKEDAKVDGIVLTEAEEAALMQKYSYKGATQHIHPYLSQLVNYTQPVKFQGFEAAEVINCHYHMSSFNEGTALGLLKNYVLDFASYNKRQLSRIYPKGGRVDSSNYIPQIFWNAGCQMVALNFQTPDISMQLNQGKFEYNGSCGYLLKPDFMHRPDRTFDPFSSIPVDGVIAAHASVQVISGQFLSDKKVGTYVEVDMYGLPTDTIRKEFRTRVIPSNGLNPVYNEKPFVFRKVVLPDLAVFRIAVFEDTGKLIGQRILPLDGLQAGYRHISLRTEGNFPMTLPTVFCKFVLETYVTEGVRDFVDAISNPIKSLSAVDKRVNAMRQIGIDESDISDVPLIPSSTNGPKNDETASTTPAVPKPSHAAFPTVPAPVQQKKEASDPGIEPVNVATLQTARPYSKLLKNQQKEVDVLKKKQQKERSAKQKAHCTAVDKLVAAHDKKREKAAMKRNKSTSDQSDEALQSDSKEQVRKLIAQQTEEWSRMANAQLQDEHALQLRHVKQQGELLKQLMNDAHNVQEKELKSRHERQTKELNLAQAKEAITASKAVSSDRNIRNKAERERRIDEIRGNNTKKFISERELLKQKHKNQEGALDKSQKEQLEELHRRNEQELEMTKKMCEEAQMQQGPETSV